MWPVRDESLVVRWKEVGGGAEGGREEWKKLSRKEKPVFSQYCHSLKLLHIQLQLFGWRRKAEKFPLHTGFPALLLWLLMKQFGAKIPQNEIRDEIRTQKTHHHQCLTL